jgi:hypothetical protein
MDILLTSTADIEEMFKAHGTNNVEVDDDVFLSLYTSQAASLCYDEPLQSTADDAQTATCKTTIRRCSQPEWKKPGCDASPNMIKLVTGSGRRYVFHCRKCNEVWDELRVEDRGTDGDPKWRKSKVAMGDAPKRCGGYRHLKWTEKRGKPCGKLLKLQTGMLTGGGEGDICTCNRALAGPSPYDSADDDVPLCKLPPRVARVYPGGKPLRVGLRCQERSAKRANDEDSDDDSDDLESSRNDVPCNTSLGKAARGGSGCATLLASVGVESHGKTAIRSDSGRAASPTIPPASIGVECDDGKTAIRSDSCTILARAGVECHGKTAIRSGAELPRPAATVESKTCSPPPPRYPVPLPAHLHPVSKPTAATASVSKQQSPLQPRPAKKRKKSGPTNEGFLNEFEPCDLGAACLVHTKVGASYFSTHRRNPFQVGCDGPCGRFLHPCCSDVLKQLSVSQINKKSFSFVCEKCA